MDLVGISGWKTPPNTFHFLQSVQKFRSEIGHQVTRGSSRLKETKPLGATPYLLISGFRFPSLSHISVVEAKIPKASQTHGSHGVADTAFPSTFSETFDPVSIDGSFQPADGSPACCFQRAAASSGECRLGRCSAGLTCRVAWVRRCTEVLEGEPSELRGSKQPGEAPLHRRLQGEAFVGRARRAGRLWKGGGRAKGRQDMGWIPVL